MGVEHNFCNKFLVGLGHGDTSEELLEIVRQVRSTRVTRVHGNEDTSVAVDFQLTTNKFDLGLLILSTLLETQLDVLDLLRHS